MPTAPAGRVRLDYAVHGDRGARPLLLVSGLGAQRIDWPPELLDALADRGHRVIAYDQRDTGRSTVLTDAGPVSRERLETAAAGGSVDVPYTLTDLGADAVALLEHLEVGAAHVVGASMGGMVAQRLAIHWPDRLRTLTSVMATTGAPDVGQPSPEALELLVAPPPPDDEAAVEQRVAGARITAGPHFDAALARRRVRRSVERGLHPDGTDRQLLAILADGDRTAELSDVEVPTLVIHGAVDPLVDVSGGRATAEAVPGAELVVLEQMGHDFPIPLIDRIAERIAAHTANRGDA